MTTIDYFNRNIPDYYPNMWMDGYSATDVYRAFKKSQQKEIEKIEQERQQAAQSASDNILNNVKLTTEIQVKKK